MTNIYKSRTALLALYVNRRGSVEPAPYDDMGVAIEPEPYDDMRVAIEPEPYDHVGVAVVITYINHSLIRVKLLLVGLFLSKTQPIF